MPCVGLAKSKQKHCSRLLPPQSEGTIFVDLMVTANHGIRVRLMVMGEIMGEQGKKMVGSALKKRKTKEMIQEQKTDAVCVFSGRVKMRY